MKKWFVMLFTVISIFAFTVGAYADAFKPADEPTTPFERIEYYVKGLTKPVLVGDGVNGIRYVVGTDTVGSAIASSDGISIVMIIKLSDAMKEIYGLEYMYVVRSMFGGADIPMNKETAEIAAHNMFVAAENDGIWFRSGYILYWCRDSIKIGGY